MLAVGVATTLVPVLMFKLTEGDQLKLDAPLAVMVVGLPTHAVALAEEVTVGNGLTVTFKVALLLQFATVPVIV